MSGKKAPLIRINLLQKKELKFSEKMLYFALHYLRYIIVLTQISVIAVFIYRFKIDQEIIDLKEKVNQLQEIMKISTPLIESANTLQTKLTYSKTVLQAQNRFNNIIKPILNAAPEPVTIDEIDFSEKSLNFKGHSADFQAIRFLDDEIKKNLHLKNLSLTAVDRDHDTGIYIFTYSGIYE